MYEYTLHWPSLKDGVVYLQCFEATQNVKLSSDMVKSNTEIQVSGHNRFGQIGICQKTDKSQALSVDPTHARKFTIYEGDWGDYYAVRVEVWHNPTHGRKHKLMDKTYRMEGWMR